MNNMKNNVFNKSNKKSRLLSMLLCISLVLSMSVFSGCNKKTVSPTSGPSESGLCEIALVTDSGTVEDGSYNEMAYKGVLQYGNENNVKVKYYIPADTEKESFITEIKNAVKDGAKVIVCSSFLLEEAVYDAAKQNKEISFILVDGEPHNKDYSDMTIAENVYVVRFANELAGFMAGYAAVRDGFRYLGFMGGMPEDNVIKFGYGYVQGADYAAIELGVKIYMAYVYTNTFSENIHVKNMAGNWYDNGVEVILACGGIMNRSVIAAAEEKGKSVITSEFDLNNRSGSIVVSCYDDITDAVYDGINAYFSGTFLGGQVKELGVKEDALGLRLDQAHLNQFSELEYQAIYNTLKAGQVDPYDNTEIANTKELDLVNTTIVYAELDQNLE